MKYGLMTFNEQGHKCRPLWDGSEWTYWLLGHRVEQIRRGHLVVSEDGTEERPLVESPIRALKQIPEPLPLVLLPTQNGYIGRIFVFNDDGSCPRPDNHPDPYCTQPLLIKYRTDSGRPKESDEIKRDLEYMINVKLEIIRKQLRQIGTVVTNLQDVERLPVTAYSHLEDESGIDVMKRCVQACETIDPFCDCGPDELKTELGSEDLS